MGLKRIFSGDWVFRPGQAHIRNGGVLMEGERVVKTGPLKHLRSLAPNAQEILLPGHGILPGLINCHTHLELCGIPRISGEQGFVQWVRELLEIKASLTGEEMENNAARGAMEARVYGTAFVADTASNLCSEKALSRMELPGLVFYEFLGLGPEGVEGFLKAAGAFKENRVLSTCHGTYSTSAELFKRIRDFSDWPLSVHLSESEDEQEFLRTNSGPFRDFLLERGIQERFFPEWGFTPVEMAHHLGFLCDRTLAVHLTYATEKDLLILKENKAHPVLCPSSNLHLSGRLPPVKGMLELGLEPCLGTDSTASGQSLNLFNEMKILVEDGADPEAVFKMATVNGKRALKIEMEDSFLAAPLKPNGAPLKSAIYAGAMGKVRWLGGLC